MPFLRSDRPNDIELADEIEFFIKRHGGDISFPPIVAFGPNASMPHHVATNIKLKRNSLMLFDFGVKLNNYCSDMTRTVFFGKASEKQKKIYETVITAQQRAITCLQTSIAHPKSSLSAKDVDKISREYILTQQFPQMPHSLGHGIGLEVHESPRLTPVSNDVLSSGMVFSIEPGVYLPGEFGIRIEDLFALEDDKLIKLTQSSNKLIEL